MFSGDTSQDTSPMSRRIGTIQIRGPAQGPVHNGPAPLDRPFQPSWFWEWIHGRTADSLLQPENRLRSERLACQCADAWSVLHIVLNHCLRYRHGSRRPCGNIPPPRPPRATAQDIRCIATRPNKRRRRSSDDNVSHGRKANGQSPWKISSNPCQNVNKTKRSFP